MAVPFEQQPLDDFCAQGLALASILVLDAREQLGHEGQRQITR
jgi:hypothetical protein